MITSCPSQDYQLHAAICYNNLGNYFPHSITSVLLGHLAVCEFSMCSHIGKEWVTLLCIYSYSMACHDRNGAVIRATIRNGIGNHPFDSLVWTFWRTNLCGPSNDQPLDLACSAVMNSVGTQCNSLIKDNECTYYGTRGQITALVSFYNYIYQYIYMWFMCGFCTPARLSNEFLPIAFFSR